MKKNISLLLFLALGSVVLMASYHRDEDTSMMEDLTSRTWKFEKAESGSDKTAFVINSLYQNSVYNFQVNHKFEGSFFEKQISGSWTFMGKNKIVLNKGTIAEEIHEIVELTDETLKIKTTEKGVPVVISYTNIQ